MYQLPQEITLASKVDKTDSKIINSLSVTALNHEQNWNGNICESSGQFDQHFYALLKKKFEADYYQNVIKIKSNMCIKMIMYIKEKLKFYDNLSISLSL